MYLVDLKNVSYVFVTCLYMFKHFNISFHLVKHEFLFFSFYFSKNHEKREISLKGNKSWKTCCAVEILKLLLYRV